MPVSASTAALVHRVPATSTSTSCIDDWSTPYHIRRGSYVIATQTDAAAAAESPLPGERYLPISDRPEFSRPLQRPSRSTLSLSAVQRLPYSRSTASCGCSRDDSADFRRPPVVDDISSPTGRELVTEFGVQGINTISQQLLDLPPVRPKRGRPRKHATP